MFGGIPSWMSSNFSVYKIPPPPNNLTIPPLFKIIHIKNHLTQFNGLDY